MAIEANKDLVRRYFDESAAKKDPELVDQFCAPGYVNHTAPPGFGTDREATKRLYGMYHAALPDWEVDVEDVIGEGDRVALRWRIYGTHQGELMGVPPTGRSVDIQGIYLARIVDGRIAESWERSDLLGLMQQIGAAPAPEQQAAPDAGSQPAPPVAGAPMTPSELREAMQRFNDQVYNQHDLDALDALVAENFRHHAPIPTPQGRDGYREFLRGFWQAFPDATSTLEDVVAEGDRVATRYTARGTHRGEFAGVPATGNRVELSGISIYRFADGRVAEEWVAPDMLGLLQQLGAVPAS